MKSYSATDVIYDAETYRVILAKYDGLWVLPNDWKLAHFENGVEPVLEDIDGDTYINPNAIIVTDLD